MPRFHLKFQSAVIKEIPIEKTPLTIGRKPDNDIVIDNMAVSGHHARVILQGNSYVLEDLNSTNGTFINDKKIITSALKHNDNVLIGQHSLLFIYPEYQQEQLPPEPSQPQALTSEATVVITPPKEGQVFPPPQVEKTGFLRVLDGKADQPEYTLSSPLVYIGKSESAVIKIKGFFAPDIAALISRKQDTYLITAIKDGYPKLNNCSLSGQAELREGDTIEVGGLKLLFQIRAN